MRYRTFLSKIQRLFPLFLSAALPLAAADERPVGLAGEGRGAIDASFVIGAFLEPPPAEFDIEYVEIGSWFDPDDIADYSAVFLSTLGSGPAWTMEQVEKVREWVGEGGTLILMSGSAYRLAGNSNNVENLEPLLGARRLTDLPEEGFLVTPGDPLVAELSPDPAPWMGGARGLTELTQATGIAGSPAGYTVTVNRIGDGMVLFMAHGFSRIDQEDGLFDYASVAGEALYAANPERHPSDREPWMLVPLGPDVTMPEEYNPPMRNELRSTVRVEEAPAGPPLALVRDGEPVVAVVHPFSPGRAMLEVAESLAEVFEAMTGQKPAVFSEGEIIATVENGQVTALSAMGEKFETAIFLGQTDLAAQLEISGEELPEEGYRLQTAGQVLFIVGHEPEQGGSNSNRHGVSGFLERHLGVRWLWPGDLGRVLPDAEEIVLQPFQESDAPAIAQRRMRVSSPNSDRLQRGMQVLGIPPEAYTPILHGTRDWMNNLRLGSHVSFGYGHAYAGYYRKYGAQHPDWFALQPNGSREQHVPRERLCKSNPGLIRQIALDKVDQLKADPRRTAVSVSPNDGSGTNLFCMCEACRKLDPPEGPSTQFMYTLGRIRVYGEYPSLTDRVLQFYNGIAEEVAKEYPKGMVAGYAYSRYRSPPLVEGVADNLIIGFVGLGYLNDHTLEVDRRRWNGWAEKTGRIFLRPNLLLGGHGMPLVYVDKMGQDLAHCYQTGMFATDFSAILNNWSTHGLNYYVLARMLWDPSLDVDALVEDYCRSGFGEAWEDVMEYFNKVREVTDLIAIEAGEQLEEELRDEEAIIPRERTRFATQLVGAYSEEVLADLRATLERALEQDENELVQQRIEFLMTGLDYADLTAAVHRAREENDREAGEALFRERYELMRDLFLDGSYAIGSPQRSWRETALQRTFNWEWND